MRKQSTPYPAAAFIRFAFAVEGCTDGVPLVGPEERKAIRTAAVELMRLYTLEERVKAKRKKVQLAL